MTGRFAFAAGLPVALSFAVLSSAAAARDQIYVARMNGEIDSISPSGTVTPLVTGLPLCNAIVSDSGGNLFVACRTGVANQDSVKKITPGGQVTDYASSLNSVGGIAFDSAGNLYYTNEVFNTTGVIRQITPQGASSTYATIPSDAWDLVFDSNGNLFVSTIDATIYKITPNAASTTLFATVGGSPGLGELAINASNDLFATDDHQVWKINHAGGAGSVSLFSQSGAADFNGMSFDSGGDLYVANSNVGIIQGITPAGAVTTIAAVPQGLDVVTVTVPEPCGAGFMIGAGWVFVRRRRA